MKTSKVWLLLALVFLAGFAGGVVATRIAVRHFVRQAIAHPARIRAKIERELDRRLDLDPPQREQMNRILRRSHERMIVLRRDFQPQFTSILQDTRQEISAVLNPVQRRRFERFLAEHPLGGAAAGNNTNTNP
jgi:hypothetical protein